MQLSHPITDEHVAHIEDVLATCADVLADVRQDRDAWRAVAIQLAKASRPYFDDQRAALDAFNKLNV